MKQWTDSDPEELEFLRELVNLLGTRRALGGECPEPDLLTAAQAGVVPPDLATGVADHLRRCRVCQILVRDFSDPELTTPVGAERARIRSTVFEGVACAASRATRPGWTWWWRPVPIVGTAVVALAVGWWTLGGRPLPPDVVMPRPAAESTRPLHLTLEKPPVTLPLATVLVWRGGSPSAQDRYLADLENALKPYRADDFIEAARRLERLAVTDPTAEVRFYLGVCRLFLGRFDRAIPDLVQARQLAGTALAREATWYLAVACDRAGQRESAVAELRTLCAEAGERQVTACEALASGRFHPTQLP